MNNPLADVPLNTKQVYVMATAREGCEVYMPVDNFNALLQLAKRDELQTYLNSQPAIAPVPAPKSYA